MSPQSPKLYLAVSGRSVSCLLLSKSGYRSGVAKMPWRLYVVVDYRARAAEGFAAAGLLEQQRHGAQAVMCVGCCCRGCCESMGDTPTATTVVYIFNAYACSGGGFRVAAVVRLIENTTIRAWVSCLSRCFFRFYCGPRRVGNTILLCGTKEGRFPQHCMVSIGPAADSLLIAYPSVWSFGHLLRTPLQRGDRRHGAPRGCDVVGLSL